VSFLPGGARLYRNLFRRCPHAFPPPGSYLSTPFDETGPALVVKARHPMPSQCAHVVTNAFLASSILGRFRLILVHVPFKCGSVISSSRAPSGVFPPRLALSSTRKVPIGLNDLFFLSVSCERFSKFDSFDSNFPPSSALPSL